MRPMNLLSTSRTNSSVMWSVGYVLSIGFSRSKQGVVAPSCKVATYSLTCACSSSMRFVALPVQMTITPVANGSSVPA